MNEEKVIQFPGTQRKPVPAAPKPKKLTDMSDATNQGDIKAIGIRTKDGALTIEKKDKTPLSEAQISLIARIATGLLSVEQMKAVDIVSSGLAFVAIGVKPTVSGADTFSAIDGPEEALHNIKGKLPEVIERAYAKRGL